MKYFDRRGHLANNTLFINVYGGVTCLVMHSRRSRKRSLNFAERKLKQVCQPQSSILIKNANKNREMQRKINMPIFMLNEIYFLASIRRHLNYPTVFDAKSGSIAKKLLVDYIYERILD